jgi:hypothetical protein
MATQAQRHREHITLPNSLERSTSVLLALVGVEREEMRLTDSLDLMNNHAILCKFRRPS